MSTYTTSESFTRTHAAHIAGRITTDLRHSLQVYKSPDEQSLEHYRLELEELLFHHHVAEYHFGFQRNGEVVWGMRYKFSPEGNLNPTSDIAGGIPRGHDVAGANFFNFLTFASGWHALEHSIRQAIQNKLPFERTPGVLPGSPAGWADDRRFSAGGVAAQRATYGGNS